MRSLDQQLKEAFNLLNISPAQQASLETFGRLVKLKDEDTYCHCIRVALYGIKVAKLLRLDPKALFYSGFLHDIGKVSIDKKLLLKQGIFSKTDYRKIQKHPLYGYYLLRGIHDFSAEVILRHHRHITSGGYPKRLPRSNISYSLATRVLIESCATILAIVDFYDAASTRKGDKFGLKDIASEEEIRTLLIQHFPDQAELINLCYDQRIFGKKDDEEIIN